MKRILTSLLFAFAAIVAPKAALAISCPPSHTFITGETLTASVLNSNPVTFSGCFNNIDNTNIGSAGLYASNLNPTTLSNAQFGGNQTYTFGAPTSASVPLRIGGVSGQTADLLDLEATVGGTILDNVNKNGTITASTGANTAFSSQVSDGVPTLLFNSNSGSNQTSLGVNTGSGYPFFSLAQLTSGGAFQKWLLGIDSSGNLQVPSGGVTAVGVSQYKPSSTAYTLPYDANSTSGSGNTHYEHGSLTTAAFSGGFACASSTSFQHSFTANPDLVYTLIGFAGTTPITMYTNTRSTSAFQACAFESGANSGTVTFSWLAVGE